METTSLDFTNMALKLFLSLVVVVVTLSVETIPVVGRCGCYLDRLSNYS